MSKLITKNEVAHSVVFVRSLVALSIFIALSANASAQDTSKANESKSAFGHSQLPVILGPDEGDHFWVFPQSKDTLGSGGEFHVYIDAETHPEAKASFARFSLGVGGSLPVHRHEKTEEFAYFISGEGVAEFYKDGNLTSVPVSEGFVWYNPPGAWHAIRNTGDVPLTLVFTTVPNEKKGLLSFFRRIGVKPGEQATPLSPEDFARIAAEHDLILKPAQNGE